MKIQTIVLSSVIGFLTGCAGVSIPSPYTAVLSVTQDCSKSYSSYCDYSYSLTNTSPRYIDPQLKVLIVDCEANTLEERIIFFDTILSNKKQTKTVSHPRSEDGGTRILILEGDSGMGYYLDGFNGSSIDFCE